MFKNRSKLKKRLTGLIKQQPPKQFPLRVQTHNRCVCAVWWCSGVVGGVWREDMLCSSWRVLLAVRERFSWCGSRCVWVCAPQGGWLGLWWCCNGRGARSCSCRPALASALLCARARSLLWRLVRVRGACSCTCAWRRERQNPTWLANFNLHIFFQEMEVRERDVINLPIAAIAIPIILLDVDRRQDTQDEIQTSILEFCT